MILAAAIESVTGILGQISALNSEYNEAVRLMEGLSGGLHVMLSFVERRINDGNPIDPVAMDHLAKTLHAVSVLINDIRVTLGKKIGCIPYGRWSVYGAPLLNECLGKAGSTKFIKRLHDAEGDLSGTIKFLELQMTANAVSALSALSNEKTFLAALFRSVTGRQFWASNFGDHFSAGQNELAAALVKEARLMGGDQANDSSLSRCFTVCAFLASDMARSEIVDAGTFASALGEASVAEWIWASMEGKAKTALVPGHHGAVSCMTCTKGYLVTGGADGTVKVFALVSDKPLQACTLVGHNDPVTCLDVSESDAVIASGSADGFIRVWSLHDGTPLACYPVTASVTTISCSGGIVAYACEGPDMCIYARCIKTGATVYKLHGNAGGVKSLRFSDSGDLFSVGADRCLKEWSADEPAPVRVVVQAHSNMLEALLLHADFVATVTNKEIRFYDPGDIVEESGFAVKLIDQCKGGCSKVRAACVVRSIGAVIVATSQPFGAMFTSRLQAIFHCDRGGVRFETVMSCRSETPSSAASHRELVFVGMDSGQVMWYSISEAGLRPSGCIGSARMGSPATVMNSRGVPLLVADGDSAVTASTDCISFHWIGGRAVVNEQVASICRAEHAGGWAAALGKGVCVYDDQGKAVRQYCLTGKAVCVQSSQPAKKLFVDVRGDDGDARSIVEIDTRTGRVADLICEPCSPDALGPALVLCDRYIVWPGYFEGTLSALDTKSICTIDAVKYDHIEIDPITLICGSNTCFVTVHGCLDLLLWNDLSGPLRRLRTYSEPVSSIFITPTDAIVAGLADGSVVTCDRTYIDHAIGGVSVYPSCSGFFSVGTEGSLVNHCMT